MAHHIVIDGNAFYEVDEDCMRKLKGRGAQNSPKGSGARPVGRCPKSMRNLQPRGSQKRNAGRGSGF